MHYSTLLPLSLCSWMNLIGFVNFPSSPWIGPSWVTDILSPFSWKGFKNKNSYPQILMPTCLSPSATSLNAIAVIPLIILNMAGQTWRDFIMNTVTDLWLVDCFIFSYLSVSESLYRYYIQIVCSYVACVASYSHIKKI
jgi:hypothetical protein